MRKPASEQESLSHWTICRPSIAAGTTGQTSISGRVAITIPPGCWEAWRGRPIASPQSCEQGAPARRGGAAGADRADDVALDLPGALVEADHLRRPSRSPPPAAPAPCRCHAPPRAGGRSGRRRRGRPARRRRRSWTRRISSSRMSRGKSRSMSGIGGDLALDLLVEEAAGEEALLDRVDVGEAGEVADDRADAGPAAAPRRQDRARRLRPAHLEGHLPGQLEYLPVEEEEAGEAEVADRRQLLPRASPRPRRGGGDGARPRIAPPAAPGRPRRGRGRRPGPRSPGSGSRAPLVRSKRRRSARRRVSATARGVGGEALGHAPRRGQHRAASCPCGPARRPRASSPAARRRGRPGGGRGRGRGSGRCRSRRRAPRAARRAGRASGCGPGRGARRAAAARP